MSEHAPTPSKGLAILLENEFDASQVRQIQELAAIAGIPITFLSYLWGYESLEFTGDDTNFKLRVTVDVTDANPTDFAGLLLPGGYAMDRLRYQPEPLCGQPNHAPAVEFLRRAVQTMDQGLIKIGAIGHGLWLFCAATETIRGRQVTCAHNIIGDVTNAGGAVMFYGNKTADVHLDRGLYTARDSSVSQLFFAGFLAQLTSQA